MAAPRDPNHPLNLWMREMTRREEEGDPPTEDLSAPEEEQGSEADQDMVMDEETEQLSR